MNCARSQQGVVYAEFLIAFTPFFLLFVGGLQLAVVATAHIVVQHAAVQAARVAVVTIDDDPAFYDDGDRKHLQTAGSGDGSDTVQRLLEVVALSGGTERSGLGARGTERLNRIRNAAYLPLSVLSPTAEQVARWLPFATDLNPKLADDSIAADLGDNPMMRVITGFGVYGRVAAAITFPNAPGSDELRDPDDAVFADDEMVTVRVTYLLPCNVPVARDLVCRSLLDMTGLPDAVRKTVQALEDPSLESVEAAYHAWRDEYPEDWERFERDFAELARAEWSTLQLPLFALPSEKFFVLRAEASLPNHGAVYKYYSELEQEGK
jgi:hypothetical protein